MENKIVAYRYKPWKWQQIVEYTFIFILIGTLSLAIVLDHLKGADLAAVLLLLIITLLVMFYLLTNLNRKKDFQQLAAKQWSFRLYKKYNQIPFIFFIGSVQNLPFTIPLYVLFKSNDQDPLRMSVLLFGTYFLLSALRGLFQFKKIAYILKTGEPVYDLYDHQK